MILSIEAALKTAFIDGLNGDPYKCPFTNWGQLSIAARHLNEYMRGDDEREKQRLKKGWKEA